MCQPINTEKFPKKLSEYLKLSSNTVCKISFTLLGVFNMYSWFSLIQVADLISSRIYNASYLADHLIMISESLPLIPVIFFTYVGAVRPKLLLGSLTITTIFSAAIPTTVYLFPELNLQSKLSLYISTVVLSFNVGLIMTISYAIAPLMPHVYSGHVSFGSGLAQGISFFVFLFASLLFPPDHHIKMLTNIKIVTLIQYFSMFICGFLAIIFYITIFTKSWFQFGITAYWDNTDKDGKNVLDCTECPLALQPARKLVYILKDSFLCLLNAFLITWLYIFMYPLIAPYSWTGSPHNELMIGVYQIADFTGRYISNYFKFASMSNKVITIMVFSRFLMIPLLTFPMEFSDTIFNTTSYQVLMMIIFGLFYGLLLVQILRNAPLSVERLKERGRVGTYSSLVLQFGSFIGVYCSVAYKSLLS